MPESYARFLGRSVLPFLLSPVLAASATAQKKVETIFVVPGSHLWPTDGMPLGFEKIAGEVAVYCDRGDVILHHCDLWHSAARATEDPPGGIRRHLRGSWNAGRRPEPGEEIEPFHKNAAR